MPNHTGTSCPRCSAQGQAHAHIVYLIVSSGCVTLPPACTWSISLDTRHRPLSPCCPLPPSGWEWDPLSLTVFTVPAGHSAGLWLQGHCLWMLQTLKDSLSFRSGSLPPSPENDIQNASCSLSILFENTAKTNFTLKAQVTLETLKYQGVSGCLWLWHKPIWNQMHVYKNIPSWLGT